MRGCVLIVEDDADVRETLRGLLADRGHPVLCAEHGEEALELLRTSVPAVILLDLVMPIMDGYTFRQAQLADAAIANVPVIVMTGETDIEDKCARLGVAAGLKKPMDVDELLEAIDRFA